MIKKPIMNCLVVIQDSALSDSALDEIKMLAKQDNNVLLAIFLQFEAVNLMNDDFFVENFLKVTNNLLACKSSLEKRKVNDRRVEGVSLGRLHELCEKANIVKTFGQLS